MARRARFESVSSYDSREAGDGRRAKGGGGRQDGGKGPWEESSPANPSPGNLWAVFVVSDSTFRWPDDERNAGPDEAGGSAPLGSVVSPYIGLMYPVRPSYPATSAPVSRSSPPPPHVSVPPPQASPLRRYTALIAASTPTREPRSPDVG